MILLLLSLSNNYVSKAKLTRVFLGFVRWVSWDCAITSRCRRSEIHKNSSFNMTNAKNNETKQEQELKSCPVAAALIMIDVGDAVSFDDNLEAVEITAMEARGREAVERYLEYDLPAEVEVSARHAHY